MTHDNGRLAEPSFYDHRRIIEIALRGASDGLLGATGFVLSCLHDAHYSAKPEDDTLLADIKEAYRKHLVADGPEGLPERLSALGRAATIALGTFAEAMARMERAGMFGTKPEGKP